MVDTPNPRDGKHLERYWTKGPGLAKWRTTPTPWRTLVGLLTKYVGPRAPGLASVYFHKVHGYWPGHRKGNNPVGPG